jgi:choline dehydrogenase-like flavoprotein
VPRFVNLGRKRRRDYRGGFTVEVRGPTALDTLGAEALRILEVDPLEAPALSYFQVHAIGESAPNPRRFVELDPTATDQFDRPVPVVNFEWGEDEPRMARDMDEAAAAIADALSSPGSRIIPVRSALTPGGVGHEAGTCAMGRDPKRSVTDLSGAVRGVPGLFVADAALMPTGLDRYPTLTVLALALSVAAGIVETAARGD